MSLPRADKKIFIDPHSGVNTRPHPAKFSDALLPVIASLIPSGTIRVCDPMAGVGKLTLVGDFEFYMNELEPEWAKQITNATAVRVGNAATYLIPPKCVVITSPPYGNRMADFFVSKTKPASMKGRYAGDLGRKLSDGSTASLKFGDKYCDEMAHIFSNITSQMVTGQYFILNISNFISSGVEQNVCGFYLKLFTDLNFTLDNMKPVITPRDRGRGANSNVRVAHEAVMLWRKL